jgi:hypothetical protein
MPHTSGLKWTEERVESLKKMKADGLTHEQIAKELNTTRYSINSAVKRYFANTGTIMGTQLRGFVSIKDIRAKYDTRSAILEKMKVIPRGEFLPESEFSALVSGSDRGRFRRCVDLYSSEFSSYRIKMKLTEGEPKWYWGHPDDIIEARKEVEAI